MIRRHLAVLAAATVLSAVVPASAQTYNRSIVFGDSLSDPGNRANLAGGFVPNYLPLQLRQFSNGPVWATQLFGPATLLPPSTVNPNVGNINFAVGGSRTSGAMTPGPTTAQQIGAYLAAGGRFGAGDIVSLWGGANNLIQSPPALAQAAAVGAAADIGNQVRQLAGAGAPTILVFNLPALGSTPQNVGGPQEAPATLLSNLFNANLATNLAAVAGAGANVISIPVDQLFAAVVANPAAFGFSNVRQACVQVPSCVASNGAGFLFWDPIHPSAQGHQLIAATVQQYLAAPGRAGGVSFVLTDGAFQTRRSVSIDGLERLSRSNGKADQWELFASATGRWERGQSLDRSLIIGAQSFGGGRGEFKDYGIRFGGFRNMGNGWTFGAMGSAGLGTIRAFKSTMETDATRLGLDLLAGWRNGQGLFVNLGLGLGLDVYSNYEYRTIGPAKNTGSTNAVSVNATAEVGYDMKFGAATLTPVARLSYLNTTLAGFTEAGIVAPVAFDSRTAQALMGAAEARVSYQFTSQFSAHAVLGYEAALSSSNDAVTGRLAGNTAQPFSFTLPKIAHPGVIAGIGASMKLGTWTLDAQYRGTFGEKGQQRHTGNIGFSTAF